jgi:hypothetical protein
MFQQTINNCNLPAIRGENQRTESHLLSAQKGNVGRNLLAFKHGNNALYVACNNRTEKHVHNVNGFFRFLTHL